MAPKGLRKVKVEGDDDAFGAVEALASEGVKLEGVKKEDVKEELDSLLKEELVEVKKEKKEKKEKKDKHKNDDESGSRKRKAEGEADEDVAEVETDTEYDSVDLSKCPQKIRIQNTGHKSIEGAYDIMKEASRGRPCYVMHGTKRTAYLFWNKKWIVSYVFGSKKYVASAKDVPGVTDPCDPYPMPWQTIDKNKDKEENQNKEAAEKDSKFIVIPQIRVTDMSTEELTKDDEVVLGMEPVGKSARHGPRKTRKQLVTPGDAGEASAEASSRPPAKTSATSAEVDEDLGPAESDNEEEQDSESDSKSDSDSDSGASSSSGPSASASASKPQAAPQAKAAPTTATLLQEQAEKRKVFCDKIQNQLFAIKNLTQRAAKLTQLKTMLTDAKREPTLRASGMDKASLIAFLDSLEREHSTRVAAAVPKQPAAPPPRSALNQQDKAVPMPSTPPDPNGAGAKGQGREPMHREREPIRSAMRPRYKQRPSPHERRLGYRAQDCVQQVQVASYRHLGEQLWFVMPGAIVNCDQCEKAVPQTMGSLQGAPGQSQFAQSMFVCSECMGISLGI